MDGLGPLPLTVTAIRHGLKLGAYLGVVEEYYPQIGVASYFRPILTQSPSGAVGSEDAGINDDEIFCRNGLLASIQILSGQEGNKDGKRGGVVYV